MAHGLADLMASRRADRPMNFSDMPQTEIDQILSDLLARSVRR